MVYATIFSHTVGLLVQKEFRAKGVVRVSRLRALKGSYASANELHRCACWHRAVLTGRKSDSRGVNVTV